MKCISCCSSVLPLDRHHRSHIEGSVSAIRNCQIIECSAGNHARRNDQGRSREKDLRPAGYLPKDAVAFGDNYNDVEMLELVGHGYLMSNAPELLKKHLPRHTTDRDHDGIAEALAAHGIC